MASMASRSTFPGRRARASGAAAAAAGKARRVLSASLSVNSSVVEPISEAVLNMADGCVAFRSLFQDSETEVHDTRNGGQTASAMNLTNDLNTAELRNHLSASI